jgi:hypothetical protein
MELVSIYLHGDYRSLFQHVKKMWHQNHVKATPDMAAFIEQQGITRHMYMSEMEVGHDTQTQQDFYRSCLAFIIYVVDMQLFENIEHIFDLEESAMKELEQDMLE